MYYFWPSYLSVCLQMHVMRNETEILKTEILFMSFKRNHIWLTANSWTEDQQIIFNPMNVLSRDLRFVA